MCAAFVFIGGVLGSAFVVLEIFRAHILGDITYEPG